MNDLPPWTKKCEENHRVEVTRRSISSHPKSKLRDLENLADDLNELFENHRDWDDAHADYTFDEVFRCIFCDEIYVPDYDEEKDKEYCRNCGKGKLEYAVKKMAESEGVSLNGK